LAVDGRSLVSAIFNVRLPSIIHRCDGCYD
jgi:hypothetical protein